MKKLFVVDGHALCYRAYYALIRNPLITSEGHNVSAIYGFARMLYRLLKDQAPDYLVMAFDPPVRSFRFDLYSEYKANRSKMPDDLRSQIEEIKRMVELMGVTTIIDEGYEADDVLGSIAHQYASKDCDVVLVTGDKDAYQLIDNNVYIYANKKGISDHEIYRAPDVKEKLGVDVNQVIDFMAITGDASDNIPGVKGIGPKGAEKLLNEFETLEGIYENIESIKGKQKEHLIEHKEMAYLSRDLVTIREDVPLHFDLEDALYNDITNEKIREFFYELEMESVVDEFFGKSEAVVKEKLPEIEKKYELLSDEKSIIEAIKKIMKKGEVSIDTETTSINAMEADLVGISLSIEPGQGWYVPLVNRSLFTDDYLPPEESLKLLIPMIKDEKIKKIGQNIKYDAIVLKNNGIEINGIYFDTLIASYLLNPSERGHNLDDLAMKHFNYKTITYKELVGTGKNAVPISEVPLDKLAEYAIEDADIAFRLYLKLRDQLKTDNLEELYFNCEMPLVEVLVEVEMTGVDIDVKHFDNLHKENDARLAEIEAAIYDLAEQSFNINSTKELAVILFEKLGLKPVRKTKTGFSTDIKVLEALQGKHEIIDYLIQYRTLNKLKTTYIDTLPKLINSKTSRIHTSYNQAVVATGRLSSSDPNMQNIPIKDDFGKKIRQGFVARDGFLMMSADYSQIELRLAAHLSDDENMKKAFNEGIDIHSLTASSVFDVSLEEVESHMRRQAKIINFATIYGVSPFGLSQQADINIKEAGDFIRIYFETYPGFKKYMDETIHYAQEHGFVQTLLGRKRYIPEINSDAVFRREGAERTAINTPIQGTSADMIKIAMINIAKELHEKKLETKMIIQVHDELVFEVKEDEKAEIEALVEEKMSSALDLSVPVVVDMGWGKNWDEAH